MLANTFGSFIDGGRAFRITNPATPMPWVNVISNGRYGLTISQNGGGFSFYDDAQHGVLTRWEMDLIRDCSGKFLYLMDTASGEVWSAAPTPTGCVHDSYSCTHTMGATVFETTKSGIRTKWTLTVAPDCGAELWLVELTNESSAARSLRVSSYLEWCCGVAPDTKREFHRLFIETTHDAKRDAIFATKNMWDIPPKSEKDHWNQHWPYAAAHAVRGPFTAKMANADKEAFIGRYGTTARPKGLVEGSAVGGFGRFADQCAAMGGDLTLAPGATVKLHYVIAAGQNASEAASIIDRFDTFEAAESAAEKTRRDWSARLGTTSVSTACEDFDLLNNYWLPYQAISGRLWGRTGYYQQSGAFGFRDQLQDSHVWLPIEPKRCIEHIWYAATRQFEDGSVNHWWHALADFGNHTACSDDYLWLPYLTSGYIKETGDFACLDKVIPFKNGGFRAPRKGEATSGTLLEHCERSIARAFTRMSERGLPHIGSCDWNDGLSAMGIEEKGESVWLAMFLCQVLSEFGAVLERVGREPLAREYAKKRQALMGAINQHAWDGEYFRCATKDSGEWIGASSCDAGQIHLNPQTWSIIADIADEERTKLAWHSAKARLVMPYGPLLLTPAYTTPDRDIGYITRYSPGSRENGGVYMHAATWALLAACKRKDVETAGRIWRSISPPSRGVRAESYYAEPYVMPGNVDGPLSATPGRAGWTWYTGSAAWANKVALEWVLGIRPTLKGLEIDPCPPRELGAVRAERTWRGVRVRVSFDAKDFEAGVTPTLTVNGAPFAGNVIDEAAAHAAAGGDGIVEVGVTWGNPVASAHGQKQAGMVMKAD
ncbi:MAG: GH36-type glycosyl hydrolase domain-containing protein [Phycisphaerales bacterium]